MRGGSLLGRKRCQAENGGALFDFHHAGVVRVVLFEQSICSLYVRQVALLHEQRTQLFRVDLTRSVGVICAVARPITVMAA